MADPAVRPARSRRADATPARGKDAGLSAKASPAKAAAQPVREPEGVAEPAGRPVCTVAFCPICLVVTAVGDVRPELVEHLLLAGREALLAFRALIDARLESVGEKDKPTGMKRITVG